jgi:hypothetical protein
VQSYALSRPSPHNLVFPSKRLGKSTALNSVADLRAKPTKPASLFGHKVAKYGWWCIDVAHGRNHKPQQANMADSGRVSHAFSLSKLRTMLLPKLFEAVKEDRAAGRSNHQTNPSNV